jgi:[ribosomal protein S18]-alanine N-acetyltransferase
VGNGAGPGAAALKRITLHRATPADLPEVIALERDCYSDPWPASSFAALPENERVFFSIARDDVRQHLAGYVVAWYVLDEGELANLAVAPDDRGRGIGQALLDAVLADAVSRKTLQLYLEVRESNTAARRLYAGRNFQEIGRRKQYYRSPREDALILRRTLQSGLDD